MAELECDPDLHRPPAVLDVHHVALMEIDYIVGNEDRLDSLDCAVIRGILHAALNDGYATHGVRMRSHPEPAQQWRQRRAQEGGQQQ